MSKTISTFVSLIVALITGDDAEVTAIKIQRKAKASLTAQIAVKTAITLDLEQAVETAEENLALARVNNGELITNNEDYVRNLFRKNDALEKAVDVLDAHLEDIEFLKAQLEIVDL